MINFENLKKAGLLWFNNLRGSTTPIGELSNTWFSDNLETLKKENIYKQDEQKSDHRMPQRDEVYTTT